MNSLRESVVLKIILEELVQADEVVLLQNRLLLKIYTALNKDNKEPDVYINNYYEEIVPNYANATYYSHFRMSRNTMEILIKELRTVFEAEHVNVDKMSVPLDKKVHVVIWMLANYAVTFRECSTLFGISTGTAHYIFIQICTAINRLCSKYIHWPSIEKAEEMAEDTFVKTNFPGVIGSLDGCHIEIKQPYGDNSYDYYNRKQFYSVILQGVCDSSLKFIDIFVGTPGKVHDARVYRLSPLHTYIDSGFIPPNMHLLADSAYGLQENIMTPFRDNGHLTRHQRLYNRKHATVRSSIERAFGLLKNKFRRLRYLDMHLMQEIPVVISACCVLHNLILTYEGYQEGEDEMDDVDDVPNLEDHQAMHFRSGENKRNNIVNLL